MLHIIWHILCSLSRIEQEFRSFIAWLVLVGFTFSNLLILVRLMYQGSSAAVFHEHNAIMLGLIIDVVTFTTALAAWVLATSNRNSPLFFKSVCLILGALACDLLLFILNPILGWVILALGASTLVCLLYGFYKQIFESCRENLQSVSNCFRQKFQFQPISQEFSGSLMLTPYVTEKQVTKLEEGLMEG